MAHTLTPRTEEETGRHQVGEAGNHFSLQLYKVPGYKRLYLTPVSEMVLWVFYITGEVVGWNRELRVHMCVLTCLLTQAEIVMLEVCPDIKTKGRAYEEHVNERPQQALSDARETLATL